MPSGCESPLIPQRNPFDSVGSSGGPCRFHTRKRPGFLLPLTDPNALDRKREIDMLSEKAALSHIMQQSRPVSPVPPSENAPQPEASKEGSKTADPETSRRGYSVPEEIPEESSSKSLLPENLAPPPGTRDSTGTEKKTTALPVPVTAPEPVAIPPADSSIKQATALTQEIESLEKALEDRTAQPILNQLFDMICNAISYPDSCGELNRQPFFTKSFFDPMHDSTAQLAINQEETRRPALAALAIPTPEQLQADLETKLTTVREAQAQLLAEINRLRVELAEKRNQLAVLKKSEPPKEEASAADEGSMVEKVQADAHTLIETFASKLAAARASRLEAERKRKTEEDAARLRELAATAAPIVDPESVRIERRKQQIEAIGRLTPDDDIDFATQFSRLNALDRSDDVDAAIRHLAQVYILKYGTTDQKEPPQSLFTIADGEWAMASGLMPGFSHMISIPRLNTITGLLYGFKPSVGDEASGSDLGGFLRNSVVQSTFRSAQAVLKPIAEAWVRDKLEHVTTSLPNTDLILRSGPVTGEELLVDYGALARKELSASINQLSRAQHLNKVLSLQFNGLAATAARLRAEAKSAMSYFTLGRFAETVSAAGFDRIFTRAAPEGESRSLVLALQPAEKLVPSMLREPENYDKYFWEVRAEFENSGTSLGRRHILAQVLWYMHYRIKPAVDWVRAHLKTTPPPSAETLIKLYEDFPQTLPSSVRGGNLKGFYVAQELLPALRLMTVRTWVDTAFSIKDQAQVRSALLNICNYVPATPDSPALVRDPETQRLLVARKTALEEKSESFKALAAVEKELTTLEAQKMDRAVAQYNALNKTIMSIKDKSIRDHALGLFNAALVSRAKKDLVEQLQTCEKPSAPFAFDKKALQHMLSLWHCKEYDDHLSPWDHCELSSADVTAKRFVDGLELQYFRTALLGLIGARKTLFEALRPASYAVKEVYDNFLREFEHLHARILLATNPAARILYSKGKDTEKRFYSVQIFCKELQYMSRTLFQHEVPHHDSRTGTSSAAPPLSEHVTADALESVIRAIAGMKSNPNYCTDKTPVFEEAISKCRALERELRLKAIREKVRGF